MVNKNVNINEKGQGLVEFSLVVVYLVIWFLLAIDPLMNIANHNIASRIVDKASHEASIYFADGYSTCLQVATEAAFAPLSGPLLFSIKDDWTLEITPCEDSSGWSPPSRVPVKATFTWNHKRMFAWNFTTQIEEVFDTTQ